MNRNEIRSLLRDLIAAETEPFSVRFAIFVSAIDRIETALRAARAEGIEEAKAREAALRAALEKLLAFARAAEATLATTGPTDENGCYTAPDGSCVSSGPCIHSPAPAAPVIPRLNIRCETTNGHVTGSTYLNVVRVEAEDDGSFTAVTDHWPAAPAVPDQPRSGMARLMADVRAFHEATDTPVRSSPGIVEGRIELRRAILREEWKETDDAILAGDLVEAADGLADIIYVAVGTALEFGIPLDAVWAEVQRSNMAKVDPATGKVRKRDDGKVLKPDGWEPPNIAGVIDAATKEG